MKRIKFLFAGVLIAAAVTSCNDVNWDDVQDLKYTPETFYKSKEYRGGNVDCSQLDMSGLAETTGRNNFNAGAFEYSWPEGLEVKVEDGKYVSFFIPGGTIKIDELCYKVGAVIVKGGDASNVYYYDGGVSGDKNLVAPNNSSGGPAGLSNLTFCFVEVDCEVKEPKVIALKALCTTSGTDNVWGVSSGTNLFESSSQWCGTWYLGVNNFPFEGTIIINQNLTNSGQPIGEMTMENGTVKVKLYTYKFRYASLFIGTQETLISVLSTDGCPDYSQAPWMTSSNTDALGNEISFTVQ